MEQNKILHICLACFYYDKMSYQENMLVKKHMEFGYKVNVVSFCDDMEDGKIVVRRPGLYYGQFGEAIYRLKTKKSTGIKRLNIFSRLSNYHFGLSEIISEFRPDIIFVHGPQTKNVYEIIKYKKRNQNVLVFADNHADAINSKRGSRKLSFIFKNIVYGRYARALSKIVVKFWGTTPARCDFLIKKYHVKRDKVGLLQTGVDEEKLSIQGKKEGRVLLDKHNVSSKDFVIITGGKFDEYKNIVPLVDAYEELIKTHQNIVLVVFGSLNQDYYEYIKNKKIIYLGWLDGTSIVNVFMNSDLSVFIGGHSTLWEESIAIGIPGIFMKYDGFEHINFNKNVLFIGQNDKNTILSTFDELLTKKDKYIELKNNALDNRRKQFYYSEIAKKAIS